jgi:tetratricopeptide (TPR) repeat protein
MPAWLLAGCLLLVLVIPLLMPRGVVFFGAPTVEAHARDKAREEIRRRFNEGVVMLHAKEYNHALTAFHRVLEIDPKMPEAHVNIGFALLGLGKPKAAADFFDTATVLRPDQMNAYYGLGEALNQLGDKLGALQSMETYLHRSPKDDPYRAKAESAVWELRAALEAEKAASPAAASKKERSGGAK